MKSNISKNIKEKIGANLYQVEKHPLCITKKKIYDVIGLDKEIFENLSPFVSVKSNFDDLLIPEDHPSRSFSDTFYENSDTVLRTHTSAHQTSLIKKGHKRFLITGDVYRRDEIDAYHYPVFHQVEGVTIFDYKVEDVEMIELMKGDLMHLSKCLFPNNDFRIVDSYFPFTRISGEIEMLFNGKWIELLGFGSIHEDILKNCGLQDSSGWAFGIGLERVAMMLFKIPDIRYFWSEDLRFKKQFEKDTVKEFSVYSKYPKVTRDISFYKPDFFNNNDFYSILNEFAQNLVSDTEITDEFEDLKTGKKSITFRVHFESLEKTLVSEEVNEMIEKIKNHLIENYSVEMR